MSVEIATLAEMTGELSDNQEVCAQKDVAQTRLPWHTNTKVIAIGDIHGDYGLAVATFLHAKLIDERYRWIAPPGTIVVQVGDQIDDYRPAPTHGRQKTYPAQDLDVLMFFRVMHSRAKERGCAVYSLIGNHEILNVLGDHRYVSQSNQDDPRYGPHGRAYAFRAGGPLAKMMSCERPMLLVVGTNLFVHGGIVPEIDQVLSEGLRGQTWCSKKGGCDVLSELNRQLREWLWSAADSEQRTRTELWLHGLQSPLWYRGHGELLPGSTISDDLHNAMRAWGIGTMVIGHTVQGSRSGKVLNHISSRTERPAIYRIDGGFSRAFDIGRRGQSAMVAEYLTISNDSEYEVSQFEIDPNASYPPILESDWSIEDLSHE